MHTRTLGAACAAALLSFTVAAADQAAPQTPTQSPVQGGTPGASQQTARPLPPATAGQVTVTGCVTREVAGQFALSNAMPSSAAAATSQTESGRSIAGSTGTPAGSGSTAGTAGTSGSTAGRPATERPREAAPAAAVPNTTYSLTGDRENELEKYVGQRLEIVGTVDGAAAGVSSGTASVPGSSGAGAVGRTGSGGDASRAPVTSPEGASGTGADANRGRVSAGAPASGHTPRLNIVSFRAVGGECG